MLTPFFHFRLIWIRYKVWNNCGLSWKRHNQPDCEAKIVTGNQLENWSLLQTRIVIITFFVSKNHNCHWVILQISHQVSPSEKSYHLPFKIDKISVWIAIFYSLSIYVRENLSYEKILSDLRPEQAQCSGRLQGAAKDDRPECIATGSVGMAQGGSRVCRLHGRSDRPLRRRQAWSCHWVRLPIVYQICQKTWNKQANNSTSSSSSSFQNLANERPPEGYHGNGLGSEIQEAGHVERGLDDQCVGRAADQDEQPGEK